MELFLVRHAIAVARADPSLDHARPLTPVGRRRFARGVDGLGALGIRLDTVLTSPWTRAVQTAELLAPLVSGPTDVTEHLAEPPGAALLDAIASAGDAGATRIGLVGHEPFLGALLAWLVVGDPDVGERLAFKKGGVAHIEGGPAPGSCALLAHWTPKSLRKIGTTHLN